MPKNNTIEEIYFYLQTLDVFLNILEEDWVNFSFDFKFDNILHRDNEILLSCCFTCYKSVVKNHQSQVGCFIRYFPKKMKFDFLKISASTQMMNEWG